jgi:hypothetical protein
MNLKRLFSIIAVVALIAIAVFILYRDREEIEKNTPTPSPSSSAGVTNVPTNVTLQGEYVCLPKKGDGPHTLECAFGIKADDGNHYSLSMNPGIAGANVPTGSHIKVTGLLVPIEQISTDMWRSYDIRGIISVETFEVK